MPPAADGNPDDWAERYAAERPVFSAYTGALESLLRQLLESADIPFVQIEGRTKEVANLAAKLKRKQGKYEDPLVDVTDLAGVRVVLYYLDDVERVGALIAEEFDLDEANSGDKKAQLDPDRFGYLSVHHVVRPSQSRRELPEWKSFAGRSAEIQVRTVLQHAWGAISRKLAYATVREAPRDLQRNLNRLSALLELADDEFVDIRLAREKIESDYDAEFEQGNLDLEIDESSVAIYLRESQAGKRLRAIAAEHGSPPQAKKDEQWGEDLEFVQESRRERFRELLSALGELGFERIVDLDSRLDSLWKEIPGFVAAVNANYKDDDGLPISASPTTWLPLILMWAERVPRESYEEARYVDELIDVVLSLYDAPAV